MIEVRRGGVFRNVGVDEVQFAAALIGVGLGDAGLPLAQHLDLGALQHDPRFDRIFDQVIVACAAVLRNVAVCRPHQLKHQLRRPAPRIACCTLSCVSGWIAQSG